VLGPPFSLFSRDSCCCTDVVMCKRILNQYVWLRTLGILCPFLWAESGSLVLQRHGCIKAELQIYFYHYKSPMIKMAEYSKGSSKACDAEAGELECTEVFDSGH